MNAGKNKRKRKNRHTGALMLAFCVAGGLCFSAFAAQDDNKTANNEWGPSTNVWLDVIHTPVEARISVTVPLSYGFAVVGSTNENAAGGISEDLGNLLLSNVRVTVSSSSNAMPGVDDDLEYSIEVLSKAVLKIRNYSTDVRDENLDTEHLKREGLEVRVEPYMVADHNRPHYWQLSAGEPTADSADFKKFRMELDGVPFSLEDDNMFYLTDKTAFELEAPMDVAANGYTAAGTANIPSEREVSVSLKVGGRQNQYREIEESMKAGEIRWRIIPGEIGNAASQ